MAVRRSPLSLSIAAVLVLIASLFFWLAAFSTPFIKSIYYVKTNVPTSEYRLGNFGLCGTLRTVAGSSLARQCYRHVGYNLFDASTGDNFIPHGMHTTGSLILVAFTAAFGSLAFFSLMHSARDLRSGFCSFFLTLFTTFLATVSFLIVVICFGTAHHRLSKADLNPHYGAALPLVIVGWLLFLASIPLVIVGWFRERHYRNETVREQPLMTSTTTTTRRGFWNRGGRV